MMKPHFYLAAFALFCAHICTIALADTATVGKVIDGDTCQLEDGTRIRYHGIDAPESGDPFGEQATKANHALVAGKSIRFELAKPAKDAHDRLLAYVYVDQLLINAELVRRGYAHVRRPVDLRYQSALLRAQEEARTSGRGMWSQVAGLNLAPPSEPDWRFSRIRLSGR